MKLPSLDVALFPEIILKTEDKSITYECFV